MPKRRRKRVQQNPLSKGQKVAIIGGIALAGGAAALYLTRPQQAPATPDASAANPAAAKAQECAALQASLVQLRSRPTPDAQEVQRFEQQVAACLAQARELGVPVDNAAAQQSTADTAYQTMVAKYGEYKATDYADALKRNNLRQEVLQSGASAATALKAAITAATSDDAVQLARLSAIRALDPAIQRRLCYLYDQPGCGRFGVNEDHGNDKAAQEQARVITPLIEAHTAAIQKLGGPGSLRIQAGLDQWMQSLVNGANTIKSFVDTKFNEYKQVDYSDALRRNNLRQEILGNGESLVSVLDNALTEARKFRYAAGVRLVAAATLAAIDASIDRHLCFVAGGPGCGTFAVNEDQPDVKARQEFDRVTKKLLGLYRKEADAMLDLGDPSLFFSLVTAKMRLASNATERAAAKFGEYTATDWSDAIKRNNLRQEVLANGALAAERLSDALTVAITGANAKPSTTSQIVAAVASRPILSSSTLRAGLTLTPTATSGLGQSPSLSYLQTLSQTNPAWTQQAASSTATSVQKALQSGRERAADRSIRSVATGIQTALDAAVNRKLCFQYDGPGCGRFGLNEADNESKAADEQRRVIDPLVASSRIASKFLADKGDANAEAPFVAPVVREVTAARDYIERQYANMKATDYTDAIKRNNLRGDILNAGRRAVAALRSAKPATASGKATLRAAAQDMLTKSREREACFRAGASGCGRFGWNEPDEATKANQEASEIGNPLAALIGDKAALAGLGDVGGGVPTWVWWVAGAGIAAAVYAHSRPSRSVRSNRSRRRTSRRAIRR